jgi:hypothetical protein
MKLNVRRNSQTRNLALELALLAMVPEAAPMLSTGGSGYTADDLKARRINVRLELQKRNLTP